MVMVHPLQNVYFNLLAGSDWKRRFEVDYWGLANRSAIESVVDLKGGRLISIKAVSRTPLDMALLDMPPDYRKRVVIVDDNARPEFILDNYRGGSICADSCFSGGYEEYFRKQVAGEDVVFISKLKQGFVADPYFNVVPFAGRIALDVAARIELLIMECSPVVGGVSARVRIRNGSDSILKTIETEG
ncbi:hypothetical protein I5U87_07190 [Stenotrophomonas maltophilia]|nr:hypothetical protein [Stenotrophomonas maltophilia]